MRSNKIVMLIVVGACSRAEVGSVPLDPVTHSPELGRLTMPIGGLGPLEPWRLIEMADGHVIAVERRTDLFWRITRTENNGDGWRWDSLTFDEYGEEGGVVGIAPNHDVFAVLRISGRLEVRDTETGVLRDAWALPLGARAFPRAVVRTADRWIVLGDAIDVGAGLRTLFVFGIEDEGGVPYPIRVPDDLNDRLLVDTPFYQILGDTLLVGQNYPGRVNRIVLGQETPLTPMTLEHGPRRAVTAEAKEAFRRGMGQLPVGRRLKITLPETYPSVTTFLSQGSAFLSVASVSGITGEVLALDAYCHWKFVDTILLGSDIRAITPLTTSVAVLRERSGLGGYTLDFFSYQQLFGGCPEGV